jgi:hypothetical protein
MTYIERINKLTQYMENYTERRKYDIVKLRNNGICYRVIGARWGISRQRAYQIYQAAKRQPEPVEEQQ